jgi:hypothetical protein
MKYKYGLIKYCKYCGKAMPRIKNQDGYRWNKTNYCSIRCSKLKVESRVCPICKIVFTPRQDLHMGKKATYCCKKCADIAKIGVHFRELKRVEKECCFCGKKISVIPYYSDKNKTCSRECFSKLKSKPMSMETRIKQSNAKLGSKSYNWKGDDATRIERKRLMSHMDYRIWRLSVFNRDNFTCQECGKTNTYLQAHHIKPWSLYPNSRYDINNGITLCKECHKLTDSYCGKIHNYKFIEKI